MNEVPQWLFSGGADGRILADFALIAEACDSDGVPRYAPRQVCDALARFLVGRGGGAHRNTPLYELCQLIRVIDAAGHDANRLWLFFLAQERLSANGCRAALDAALANGGWRRPGFTAKNTGIAIQYGAECFEILYGRMPFLTALYEFLLGMEEFDFAEEFAAIVAALTAGEGEDADTAIRTATNALAKRLRRYRRDHLSHSRHEESFDVILAFIRSGDQAEFDDDTILAFWQTHNTAEYRQYTTAFDAFVTFAAVMGANGLRQASQTAQSLDSGGAEDSSIDPADDGQSAFDGGIWESPMPLLDQEPACRIRFFMQSSERRLLDGLMQVGPFCQRLPRAYLRRETFGAVQSGITTDLRVGRDGSLDRRIECQEAETYDERRRRLAALSEHIHTLQLACLHALLSQSETLAEERLDELAQEQRQALLADCAATFKRMTRKGFDETDLADEAHREGFRIGADVLGRVNQQLDRFLTALRRLDGGADDLTREFVADHDIFVDEFRKLYGGRHGTL